MRSIRLASFLITLLAVVSVPALTTSQTPQLPAPVGTGFIAGQVIQEGDGKPVAEAIVTLTGRVPQLIARGGPSTMSLAVIADARGRFFFASLPAGTYTVAAQKTGYLPSARAALELNDNERVVDSRLRLTKFASLTGTLRDSVGDPVVGTHVVALRRTLVNGHPELQPIGTGASDDRGRYRIANVVPGDYFICACSRETIPIDGLLLTTLASQPLQLMSVAARALMVGSDVVSLDDGLRTYAPVFYPGVANAGRAERLTLAPGEERLGLDMTVPLVRAARVSGQVVGATGPVHASSMRLVPASDGGLTPEGLSLPPMLVQADGRFDFAPVPPGQYRLIVLHRDLATQAAGPSGAALAFTGGRGTTIPQGPTTVPGTGIPMMWADEPITVGTGGVIGLTVPLNPATPISGRVQFVGAAPLPPAENLSRAAILLQPLERSLFGSAGTAVGRMTPENTFSVAGVLPGSYIVTVNVLPGYPNLKSIVVNGVDVTDLPFEVGVREIRDVTLTFVDTPLASLNVIVGQAPAEANGDDAAVLLFPADRRFWMEPAAARRRFRTSAITAARASVTLTSVPAGDYFVVAASGRDIVDWQDMTKLDALSRRAQRVSIVDGGAQSVTVRR